MTILLLLLIAVLLAICAWLYFRGPQLASKARERLIDDARKWWRMFSIQMMGASVAVQSAYAGLDDSIKQFIPPKIMLGVSIFLLLLGIVGRLIKQPNATPVASALIDAAKQQGGGQ